MSNNHLSLAPCCQQMFHEKEMFKRALHREREKRRFVELAYKDLLKIHQNLIELKSTLDVSSSSFIISSTANEHQPEQQNTQNFEIASSPITLLTKPSKNFLKQRVQFNEQSAKHLPSSPSFGMNKDSANEVFQSNSQGPCY
ncbi:hypothetical protein Mgra_00005656 [Meloidogyne graminicola]|uniref:Uncharacterized protein n=1 Tax=Meloidogyne graminicola TaxID=189291 RepID=A0A8S9ZNB9_9BILA|nr:hypothetical protein Mgra_00005656 [Meloidogyne graminicola]